MASRVRRAGALLGAGLTLALGAGCGRSKAAKEGAAAAQAPDFELKDLSGKTVRLSDFRGKVVLIDFWATYCGPCHESIPVFQRLYAEHRSQGLEVVGISLDAFSEQVPGFVKEIGMTYTVLLDPDNAAQRAYGVRGLPTTFLVDGAGAIRQEWVGFDETVGAEIQEGVRGLLRGKASS